MLNIQELIRLKKEQKVLYDKQTELSDRAMRLSIPLDPSAPFSQIKELYIEYCKSKKLKCTNKELLFIILCFSCPISFAEGRIAHDTMRNLQKIFYCSRQNIHSHFKSLMFLYGQDVVFSENVNRAISYIFENIEK